MINVKKKRRPTKRTQDKFGRERIVKISELCQYCPYHGCEGWYRVDAPRACLTFRSWKEEELTLEEAVKAKRRQHERHKKTDRVRNEIYKLLEGQCYDYGDRRMAGSVATDVVKGIPIEDALEWGGFYLNKSECKKIRVMVSKMNENSRET